MATLVPKTDPAIIALIRTITSWPPATTTGGGSSSPTVGQTWPLK